MLFLTAMAVSVMPTKVQAQEWVTVCGYVMVAGANNVMPEAQVALVIPRVNYDLYHYANDNKC